MVDGVKWTYRRLRVKIEMGNPHVKDEFQNFLHKFCEEGDKNFEEEFGEQPEAVNPGTVNPGPSALADTDIPPTDENPEQARNLQREIVSHQGNQTNSPSSQDGKIGTSVIPSLL